MIALDTFPEPCRLDEGEDETMLPLAGAIDNNGQPDPSYLPIGSEVPPVPKAKRQRAPRRTKALIALEAEMKSTLREEKTLSEKRSAAARKRWSAQSSIAPIEPLDAHQPVVSFVAPNLSYDVAESSPLKLSKETLSWVCESAIACNPTEDPFRFKEELDIYNKMCSMVSVKSVADGVGKDEKTVKAVTRLLAATCVLSKRCRNLCQVERVHKHLKAIGGSSFKALQALCKDKFDEMQLKIRTLEQIKGVDDKGNTVGIKKSGRTKLMQVTSTSHYLWRIHGQYISLRQRNPTTLTPIDSTTGECITEALTRQSPPMSWCQGEFLQCGRISVSDEHASNGVADWELFRQRQWLPLVRLICKFHKIGKTGHTVLRCFPIDKTGFVHSTLSFMFTGAWSTFLAVFKKFIEDNLERVSFGTQGAGPKAAAHRAAINALFRRHDDTKLSGPGVAQARLRDMAKDELLNGHYDSDAVQHFCTGQCCCNRKESVQRVNDEVIDRIPCPKPFNLDKWIGEEDSFSFHGEWMSTHRLLQRVYDLAFCRTPGARKSRQRETAAAAPGHRVEEAAERTDVPFDEAEQRDDSDIELAHHENVEIAQPIADGSVNMDNFDAYGGGPRPEVPFLQEVDYEATAVERASTYRGNALNWYRSAPLPRYLCMKVVHSTQQLHMVQLMSQVGVSWEQRELLRRSKGEEPRYRGLMVASGEFTDPALLRFASLVKHASHWQDLLRDEDKIHALSNATFRACASGAAITVQLQAAREKDFPWKPYMILRSKCREARHAIACDLDRERREHACLLPPYWYELLSKFPSPELICSHNLDGTSTNTLIVTYE